MPGTDKSSLLEPVEKLFVINLESRTDRRRDMTAELARLNLSPDSSHAEFFPAFRPDQADPFPSIGAHGCFLSHLAVLRQARDEGHQAILLLEDDAAFVSDALPDIPKALSELRDLDWAFAYLGHRIEQTLIPGPDQAKTDHWRAVPSTVHVETAHAVVIHERAIHLLIPYLEAMQARPAGDAQGGPMHVDGAYSWFRRAHPQMQTLVTPRQYVQQRASKSDITPQSWKDSLPLIGWLRALRNRLR